MVFLLLVSGLTPLVTNSLVTSVLGKRLRLTFRLSIDHLGGGTWSWRRRPFRPSWPGSCSALEGKSVSHGTQTVSLLADSFCFLCQFAVRGLGRLPLSVGLFLL